MCSMWLTCYLLYCQLQASYVRHTAVTYHHNVTCFIHGLNRCVILTSLPIVGERVVSCFLIPGRISLALGRCLPRATASKKLLSQAHCAFKLDARLHAGSRLSTSIIRQQITPIQHQSSVNRMLICDGPGLEFTHEAASDRHKPPPIYRHLIYLLSVRTYTFYTIREQRFC